ncbi:MAG: Holliday junction resolvase RuvX [Candidatus Firestonebacteria bacterium]
MTILGVDYGDKRVGLAINDGLGLMAHSLKVVPKTSALQDIKKIVLEYEVKLIVVGLPVNLKGEIAFKAKQVLLWIEELKKVSGVPIETFDERFSTFEAEEELLQSDLSRDKRKKIVDKLAARNILQGYLNMKKEKE